MISCFDIVEARFSLAPFDFDYILLSFVGDRSLSRKFYKERLSLLWITQLAL